MAAQIVAQIARFAGARETWTFVVAPIAVVVGFVGYHAEGYMRSDEERERANSPAESTTDLRVARELEAIKERRAAAQGGGSAPSAPSS